MHLHHMQHHSALQHPAYAKHKRSQQQHLDNVACQAPVVVMGHYPVLQLVCEVEQAVGDKDVHYWQQDQTKTAAAGTVFVRPPGLGVN